MPVILTTDEQRDVWMVHRGTKPRHCNGRCRMMRLESFARCGQGRSGGGLIGLNGLMSLNASQNAEWETTAVTTELPKEGADRRMWVAEVLTGARRLSLGAPFLLRCSVDDFGSVLLIACKPRRSLSKQGVGLPFVNRRA